MTIQEILDAINNSTPIFIVRDEQDIIVPIPVGLVKEPIMHELNFGDTNKDSTAICVMYVDSESDVASNALLDLAYAYPHQCFKTLPHAKEILLARLKAEIEELERKKCQLIDELENNSL